MVGDPRKSTTIPILKKACKNPAKIKREWLEAERDYFMQEEGNADKKKGSKKRSRRKPRELDLVS